MVSPPVPRSSHSDKVQIKPAWSHLQYPGLHILTRCRSRDPLIPVCHNAGLTSCRLETTSLAFFRGAPPAFSILASSAPVFACSGASCFCSGSSSFSAAAICFARRATSEASSAATCNKVQTWNLGPSVHDVASSTSDFACSSASFFCSGSSSFCAATWHALGF